MSDLRTRFKVSGFWVFKLMLEDFLRGGSPKRRCRFENATKTNNHKKRWGITIAPALLNLEPPIDRLLTTFHFG